MDIIFLKFETMLANSSLPEDSQELLRERFSRLLPGERIRLVTTWRQHPGLLGEMKNLLLARDAVAFEASLGSALGAIA